MDPKCLFFLIEIPLSWSGEFSKNKKIKTQEFSVQEINLRSRKNEVSLQVPISGIKIKGKGSQKLGIEMISFLMLAPWKRKENDRPAILLTGKSSFSDFWKEKWDFHKIQKSDWKRENYYGKVIQ